MIFFFDLQSGIRAGGREGKDFQRADQFFPARTLQISVRRRGQLESPSSKGGRRLDLKRGKGATSIFWGFSIAASVWNSNLCTRTWQGWKPTADLTCSSRQQTYCAEPLSQSPVKRARRQNEHASRRLWRERSDRRLTIADLRIKFSSPNGRIECKSASWVLRVSGGSRSVRRENSRTAENS